jgi:lipid-A-disaccharide synthase-like uncharacterized protein
MSTAADCIREASTLWLTIGFVGQALFSGRFLVQWLYSEKMKQSLIPTAFWYFSIAGGLVLLAYALHKQDPVFIAGQAFGLLVYFRNLYLLVENKKLRDDVAARSTPAPQEEITSQQKAS